MGRSLPSKLVPETITVKFNFSGDLGLAETITDVQISVEVLSGEDALPSGIISGDATIEEGVVSQNFTMGVPGTVYALIAAADGSSGASYVRTQRLAVLSSSGRFGPAGTIALLGELPDGTARVPYEAPLYIVGGISPFEYDDIFSGAAPFWMGFSIDGTQLICQGLPDEMETTAYTFAPQVEDAANNEANAPQNITIFHITISGDLGD